MNFILWREWREVRWERASSLSSDWATVREDRRGQKRARLCSQSGLISVTAR